jgi:hypothetical protein
MLRDGIALIVLLVRVFLGDSIGACVHVKARLIIQMPTASRSGSEKYK